MSFEGRSQLRQSEVSDSELLLFYLSTEVAILKSQHFLKGAQP